MVAYSVELCWRPWPGDQVWVVWDVAHPRVHLEGPNQKEAPRACLAASKNVWLCFQTRLDRQESRKKSGR